MGALSAFHASLYGGFLMADATLILLKDYDLVTGFQENGNEDTENKRVALNVLQYTFAVYGFWSQLKNVFAVSWYLRLLFFPAIMLESILQLFTAGSSSGVSSMMGF